MSQLPGTFPRLRALEVKCALQPAGRATGKPGGRASQVEEVGHGRDGCGGGWRDGGSWRGCLASKVDRIAAWGAASLAVVNPG